MLFPLLNCFSDFTVLGLGYGIIPGGQGHLKFTKDLSSYLRWLALWGVGGGERGGENSLIFMLSALWKFSRNASLGALGPVTRVACWGGS